MSENGNHETSNVQRSRRGGGDPLRGAGVDERRDVGRAPDGDALQLLSLDGLAWAIAHRRVPPRASDSASGDR